MAALNLVPAALFLSTEVHKKICLPSKSVRLQELASVPDGRPTENGCTSLWIPAKPRWLDLLHFLQRRTSGGSAFRTAHRNKSPPDRPRRKVSPSPPTADRSSPRLATETAPSGTTTRTAITRFLPKAIPFRRRLPGMLRKSIS